ncbi:hypothetical protein DDB_G0271486 [Dictyostelium discoideum AX4]|uniref:Uncharacterized protein n=1 Tax=Dictyostelium discoideum TaxID=44689 RepID=Q55B12_DICDI|nr:hypothetical protein DDB_G0271486 [Dictyostelium discoideum AX4]EAL71873.1 hypothetical protein DDB_G0271486 [Dictyostelium discoideum AX4]|eukprot:XP_645800.1 hypothetical protein DDB_G0271486 [Dictyostelium discoideum AX4]
MRRRGPMRRGPVIVAPRRGVGLGTLAAGVGVGMLASSASRPHYAPPPPPPPQQVIHTYQQLPPQVIVQQPGVQPQMIFDPATGQYYQVAQPPIVQTTTVQNPYGY